MLLHLLAALGLVSTFQKTKCKNLLAITMEKIKLLEKRRQARVRQLYRDVMVLLLLKKENKVDSLLVHIWKELCLFFVYTKVAEYCGFVQINLKDIAAERECPNSLEEPLASLCFAASCCGDLLELQELREILAMKYGKQIVSSGQNLEPNCHVNHQLLDCLYAKDPSKAEKQAVLEDIIRRYKVIQGHRPGMQHQDYVNTQGMRLVSEQLNGHELCSGLQIEEVTADLNKDMMSSEELSAVCSRKPPLYSQPPQRPPPPPPPPKRVPPPPPPVLQVISKASFQYDKHVHAIANPVGHCSTMANDCNPLGRCSTMANDHHVESYGSGHVHPRLPKYDDLVAYFTALKG